MFYAVASPGWRPGQPLNPSGGLLFRSKAEAESFAPEALAVAVAIRYDARRSEIRPQGPVASASAGPWSAPAVANSLGDVSVFGSIPSALIRLASEVEVLARWRPESEEESSRPARAGFGGWDSLTMALLA
jgi:hypothetical protein